MPETLYWNVLRRSAAWLDGNFNHTVAPLFEQVVSGFDLR